MSKQAKKITGKSRKTDTVKALSEKLAKTKSLFLTDYRGLTHKQMEELRRALKKAEADFLVAKNTLLKIALKDWNSEAEKELDSLLNNPTATFFTYGDEVTAIKILAQFMKTNQLPKIKAGVFGGKQVSEADFQKLASLPSREILLATLAARLQSPVSGLHNALSWNLRKFVTVLDNIKNKKPQTAAN
ncbi:MAG: 50S ribosomal protein L10 [Patescibacteria group bacterium]|nr:50S ribosomal protein L10 [Patescibacteria group bacterium]